jgi:hypothetical protein
MEIKKICFKLLLVCLLAMPPILRGEVESNHSIPLTTDYPPLSSSPPSIDSEQMRTQQYKKATFFVLTTIITATVGLLASGSNTGKDAKSHS